MAGPYLTRIISSFSVASPVAPFFSFEGALASRIAGHAGPSANSFIKHTIRLALIIRVDRSRFFGGDRSAWGNRPPLRPLRRHHMPLTANCFKIDSAGLARDWAMSPHEDDGDSEMFSFKGGW